MNSIQNKGDCSATRDFPIAVFAYNRPSHLLRSLESLVAVPRIHEHQVFIICDGPKTNSDADKVHAVRQIASRFSRQFGFNYIIRSENLGLSTSIYTSVTDICRKSGSILVLEDDIVVSPELVSFVADGLTRYRDEKRVKQIASFCPVDHVATEESSFFLPFTTSWGWATWWRAWKEFKIDDDPPPMSRESRWRFDLNGSYPYHSLSMLQSRGKVDSWAIKWYRTVFDREGLVLYPKHALAQNLGFDGTGTNCGIHQVEHKQLKGGSEITFPTEISVSNSAFNSITRSYRGVFGIRYLLRKARFLTKASMRRRA